MATIADIRDWVTGIALRRADIATEALEAAIEAYQVLTSKIPFEELQTKVTVPTIASTVSYDLTSHNVAGIMSIRINYTATQGARLARKNTRLFDNNGIVAAGKPNQYARFAKSIELFPTPSSVYDMNIRFWKHAVINLADRPATVLVLPDPWVALMRWETLYRVYLMLKMNAEAAALVMTSLQPRLPTGKKQLMWDLGIIPRLWNELLSTISEREHIDEEISINPVVRKYTNA